MAYHQVMVMAIEAQTVPLTSDTDGVLRVGGTRVTLETLYQAFQSGATAEEISVRFDVLRLADIYAVIGYCLSHADQVAAYLSEREHIAVETRQMTGVGQSGMAIRQRLERRRTLGA